LALSPGTRLGAYEILAAIGAGGMGEVYRARDTKLEREVAIKVLPAHLAIDPEARARFEREAKAVASLSHPNILAIHDFGVQDGTAYAVLELLHGDTLRDRLLREPVPSARKTIDIATQIAQGLAAAHAHGIAHRDLKPENVFVCADGRVKILDFGLARQLASPPDDDANSPTAMRHTDPGTVLGTVGYMSPEQVRGQSANERSDIFSFGCVLFEMATGRRAFHGETPAETMTAILRAEPLDLTSDAAPVPSGLEPIVRHCLEKRPEDRFHSAKDLGFALQMQSGSQPSSRETAPVRLAPRRRREWVWAIAGATAGAVAVLALRGTGSLARGQSATAAQLIAFQQVTDSPGVETTPSVSPDGKSVVYASDAAGNSDL
jgi:eukaryotic-like serine/threonine-protein kinase